MDSVKKRKAKEIALIARLNRYESETSGHLELPLNLKYTKFIEKHKRRSLAQFAAEKRLMSYNLENRVSQRSTSFSNLLTNGDHRDAIEESRRQCLKVINYRNNHSWNAAYKVYQRRSRERDTIPETHKDQNAKLSFSRDVGGKDGFLPSLAGPSSKVVHGVKGPKLLTTFPITKDEAYNRYYYLLPKKSSRFLPMMSETTRKKL